MHAHVTAGVPDRSSHLKSDQSSRRWPALRAHRWPLCFNSFKYSRSAERNESSYEKGENLFWSEYVFTYKSGGTET